MATEIKSWNPLAHIQSPLRWRTPKWVRIEADVFAPGVKDQDIDKLLAVVALRPQLNFIMPTEHTERMAAYFATGDERRSDVCDAMNRLEELRRGPMDGDMHGWGEPSPWPLPNLLPGASVEDQATADERIPHLLRCPAKLRMVDARLRGAVDLNDITIPSGAGEHHFSALHHDGDAADDADFDGSLISWITCRGTTEPMHPDWVRSLRDQCAAAGVPFRFEGWGEWRPPVDGETYNTLHGRMGKPPAFLVDTRGNVHCTRNAAGPNATAMLHVGNKKAGRLLDGVEHDAMPEVGHD